MEDLDFGMEMPTPCEHCGKTFDLTDGYRSEKWHIDITICSDCHTKEQEEIEQDDFWEMINCELGETLEYLKDKEGAWAKFTDENKALIIQLVSQRSELLAFKQFISKTPLAELELYSDEEFTDLYIKANCD